MQARLKVLHDKANVKFVKLLPVTLIGRSTDCNLKIASSQVSRAHCRITLGEDTVLVEDLGSANGTMVDGQMLIAHQPKAIAPGAMLVIGPAEFQIDYVASTSETRVLSPSNNRSVQEEGSTELLTPDATNAIQERIANAGLESEAEDRSDAVTPPPAVTRRASTTPAAANVVASPTPSAEPIAVEAALATVDPVAVAIPVAAAVVAGVVMANQPTSQPAEFEATLLDFSSHNTDSHNTEMPPQSAATEEDTFMFGEANEETAAAVDESPFSFDDAAAAPSTRSANTVKGQKEAGMKSLFSLFGRKGKETKPVRAKSTSDPDVFLPTTATVPEAVPVAASSESPAAVDDSPFNLEGVSGEDAIASNAVEVTEAEAPTQQLASEDDIASFLNQL